MELISKQDALDIVEEYARNLYGYIGTPEDNETYSYGRGLLLSIKRNLKRLQPANNSEIQNSSDTISRQATIDALGEYLIGKKCPDDGTLTARLIENNVINKLPPAEPKRGKWKIL